MAARVGAAGIHTVRGARRAAALPGGLRRHVSDRRGHLG